MKYAIFSVFIFSMLFVSCNKDEVPNYDELIEVKIAAENNDFSNQQCNFFTLELTNLSNNDLSINSSYELVMTNNETSVEFNKLVDIVDGLITGSAPHITMNLFAKDVYRKKIDLSELNLPKGSYQLKIVMDIDDSGSPNFIEVHSNELTLDLK
ncbi:MAG: hypothetical protein MI922_21200 [Bacteroidales bacterium]|nr:hypothetical protein [Bacteroidales bacterium]